MLQVRFHPFWYKTGWSDEGISPSSIQVKRETEYQQTKEIERNKGAWTRYFHLRYFPTVLCCSVQRLTCIGTHIEHIIDLNLSDVQTIKSIRRHTILTAVIFFTPDRN